MNTTEKPMPPDDTYEVMLGRDVPENPDPDTLFLNRDKIWELRPFRGLNVAASDSHTWYAVPRSSLPTSPDLYAELKAAHAAGKVIQQLESGDWKDLPANQAQFAMQAFNPVTAMLYRIKPEPDAEGWIPHTPGNECPCNGDTKVECKLWDGTIAPVNIARARIWDTRPSENSQIIAWRPANPSPTVEQEAPAPTDPKKAYGDQKPPLALLPPAFNEAVALALQTGAVKYGAWNWRENKVEAMTYAHAIRRHLDAWIEREECAPDSGVNHLGHVAASCAILLDAGKHGMLVDNRPPTAKN